MRARGVSIPVYGAIEQSSNRRSPQIAMFALGSFSRYKEVKNGGFFRILSTLRLIQSLTESNLEDEDFTVKAEFDSEYFRRVTRGKREKESSEFKGREKRKEEN